MSYWRFAAMIATSTLVMFGLMYIHTYIWDHAYFSETRAWMALLMGAVMAIIMLGYMLNSASEPLEVFLVRVRERAQRIHQVGMRRVPDNMTAK